MKAKRLCFELTLIVVIAALLVWKFWPAKDAASPPVAAATGPAETKNVALPVVASMAVVEAPKLPPTNVPTSPDNLPVPGNGSNLYDSSKARAAALASAENGDNDFATVINGSPAIQKLRTQMAQDAELTQALTPIDPSSLPPMTVTDLGEIALTKDQPETRKLASGDQAMFTLITSPISFGKGAEPPLIVRVDVLHPNADGTVDTVQRAGTAFELG